MAENGAAAKPQLTGEVMFYRQPEPLSVEKHRMLGVKNVDWPFKFLAEANVVPITVNEFPVACASYPIIFAGAEKVPLAVMGVKTGENCFVSPEGLVDPEVYLPVFARRYPFVFAASSGGDQMVVCIDRAAPMLVEGGDIPLFNGNEPSKFTQEAIEFCTEFERFRLNSLALVQRITELDLWHTRNITLTPTDAKGAAQEPIPIADFFCVSEEKLNALPAQAFDKLRTDGWLAIIYSHMLSLAQWSKLLNRSVTISMARQQQAAAPAAGAPKRK